MHGESQHACASPAAQLVSHRQVCYHSVAFCFCKFFSAAGYLVNPDLVQLASLIELTRLALLGLELLNFKAVIFKKFKVSRGAPNIIYQTKKEQKHGVY